MMVVWVLGALIVYRVQRFHITATYVVSFLVLAALRAAITGHPFLAEVAPITGPMYQLFIFFMITDPKTTVTPKWGQCLVAFLVAVVEMILRLAQNVNAPFYRADDRRTDRRWSSTSGGRRESRRTLPA